LAAAEAALAAFDAQPAPLPLRVFATGGLLLQHMDACCPQVSSVQSREPRAYD